MAAQSLEVGPFRLCLNQKYKGFPRKSGRRKQSINVVAVIEWVTTFDNVTHLMSHIHRAVIAPNSSTLLIPVKTFRQTQHSFAHYTDLSEMTTWPSLDFHADKVPFRLHGNNVSF